MRSNVIALLCIVLGYVGPANAQCDALSKYGIYDISSNASMNTRAESFRNWFCQNQFQSEGDANEAGADFGYGGFALGFDSEKQSWAEFQYQYCHDDFYSSSYASKTKEFVKKINPQMVSALESCLKKPGLHAWIEQGPTMEMFSFRARFTPSTSFGVPNPVVEAFSVKNAKCEGVIGVGRSIGADGDEISCSRLPSEKSGCVTSYDAASILFDADYAVDKDTPLFLRSFCIPIPPPPLPIPVKESIYIRAIDYTNGIDVAPAGGAVASYGDVLLNAPPYNSRPNMAEYKFSASAAGKYNLSIEYAAAQSRPVKITINGEPYRAAALSGVTGCWELACQHVEKVGDVRLLEGLNTIRIERGDVFPHLRTIRFDPD